MKARRTDISVVIPTYNRAHLLRRALTSVVEQSPSPSEVIVVDDGSTDDTASVVEEFDGVLHLRQSNQGAAVARNYGVAQATNEFVAFLDSDDYWLPGHLAALDDARAATDGAASLYFDDCYFSAPGHDQDRTLWDLAGFAPDQPFELCSDPFSWALLSLQPTMLQSSMIATSAYTEHSGLDPRLRLRHDTALFFALAQSPPWCAVGHVGVQMTPDADNRLTVALPDSSPEYWVETVTMYAELLEASRHRSPSERAEIRSRLATAHWRRARMAGTYRSSSARRDIGRAVSTSPSTVGRLVRAAVGRLQST